MEKLIRMQNVTDATGFTRGWIYVLIRKGEFPTPVKVGKRAIRFRQSEVADWIASRRQASG
jgi:prophage regulatory protein